MTDLPFCYQEFCSSVLVPSSDALAPSSVRVTDLPFCYQEFCSSVLVPSSDALAPSSVRVTDLPFCYQEPLVASLFLVAMPLLLVALE